MCFSAAAFSENDHGSTNLASKYGVEVVHEPVKCGGQVPVNRVLDPALHVADRPTRVALVPAPVERLGGDAELHDEVVGEVLRLRATQSRAAASP